MVSTRVAEALEVTVWERTRQRTSPKEEETKLAPLAHWKSDSVGLRPDVRAIELREFRNEVPRAKLTHACRHQYVCIQSPVVQA